MPKWEKESQITWLIKVVTVFSHILLPSLSQQFNYVVKEVCGLRCKFSTTCCTASSSKSDRDSGRGCNLWERTRENTVDEEGFHTTPHRKSVAFFAHVRTGIVMQQYKSVDHCWILADKFAVHFIEFSTVKICSDG